ncbi:2OG-Fe(II) oxygenase family protein [Brevundimonas diminuta]|uniref:2OG-Fe(II) oxygenase family protein n=1 Tax=Brevundimonas diminuta TaxID=293 RepID=UPI00320A281F
MIPAGGLALNPALVAADYAEVYARDGMVQISDFLTEESAEWLATTLERATPWRLALSQQGKGQILKADEARALGAAEMQRRVGAAAAEAAAGFAFVYQAYPIISAMLDGEDAGHPTHLLVEFFNSPAFIAFARTVTGESGLTKIDAQATCFQPGNFLTLHDDTGDGERRAAYTLGLTREWRADWGGQLLFHDEGGDVLRGFKPRFNAWTLFRTPQLHSVSQVANYAAKPRLTVTGWLRDDPPHRRG